MLLGRIRFTGPLFDGVGGRWKTTFWRITRALPRSSCKSIFCICHWAEKLRQPHRRALRATRACQNCLLREAGG